MKTLVITCPSAATDSTLRKLEHYYGIEFTRGASNGGGDNDYHAMLGDEELLSSLYFHNQIKVGFVKDAKQTGLLNQVNWNKTSGGATADLSCSDGSDVLQIVPTMYAIFGGTNATYERQMVSDEFFSYDGDDAVEVAAFADSPDFITIKDGKARSIYDTTVAGTQTATKFTLSNVSDYADNLGYPRCSLTRYNYEAYARAKNSNSTLNEPYTNASCLDSEFWYLMLLIECRTKILTDVFGHGISSNVGVSASNWGTVSGMKFTKSDGTVTYKKFNESIFVSGASTNVWSLLNGQCPLLKIFEAQKAVSDGGNFENVYNSDGDALQGKGSGVMTGIYTKTFTGTITCGMSSTETASEYDVEITLRVPIWRGRTRLWGNIWQHLSGYEVLKYTDEDETVHQMLFRAKSVSQMTTDSDEAVKTSPTGFGFTTSYDQIGDLKDGGGWGAQTISANGRSTLCCNKNGGSISNYEQAYLYLDAAKTTVGNYYRKTAGCFGGRAAFDAAVFRYCAASFAPSDGVAAFGSGCRCAMAA